MAYLSKLLGLEGPIPFVDIDVSADNRLFVDPCRIRLSKDLSPWREQALRGIDSFLDNLLTPLSSSADDRSQTLDRDLLTRFTEPTETRLGMSKSGFHGHGGAKDIGNRIALSLETNLNALVKVGIIHHLEELPLFVEGVDKDITSDITTRLIFPALVNFTAEMCQQFPALRTVETGMRPFRIQTWDPDALRWRMLDLELPSTGGEALVLVPHQWVGSTLLMHHGRYYDISVLGYMQLLGSWVDGDGRIQKPTKKSLKKGSECPRGRATNIRLTLQAHQAGQNLVEEFRAIVDFKYEKDREKPDRRA